MSIQKDIGKATRKAELVKQLTERQVNIYGKTLRERDKWRIIDYRQVIKRQFEAKSLKELISEAATAKKLDSLKF